MKTQVRDATPAPIVGRSDLIRVIVRAAGRSEFQESFTATTTNKEIKTRALAYFGLAAVLMEQYGLQHRGKDQPEHQMISKVGLAEVRLTLIHKQTGGQFGDALFQADSRDSAEL